MKEINNKGNLPKPLQIMAKEFQGIKTTIFYECESDIELLNLAKDGKCEETTVIMDKENNRGFMTAFSFEDSQIENLNGSKLVQMKLYYTELKKNKVEYYRKMLSNHRRQQEDQMINRQNKNSIITGGSND